MKQCYKCGSFRVRVAPNMPYDTGLVECEKHGLVCDVVSTQHIKRLTCVEEESEGKGRDFQAVQDT